MEQKLAGVTLKKKTGEQLCGVPLSFFLQELKS